MNSEAGQGRLPARKLDAHGRAHVDFRAVLALALPLVANSAVQLLLNLTDIWFIGRISTDALAAVGAVHWLAIVVVMLLAGIGMAVQTVVAQAHGARRQARAAQAVWIALWGLLITTPLFIAAGLAIRPVLAPFGLEPRLVSLAADFWLPRVGGSAFGAAVWALLGFFNGIGRPRVTLWVTALMAVSNALCNEIYIVHLHLGVFGSGLATATAQAIGCVAALALFLQGHYRRGYRTHLTWTPNLRRIGAQFRLGVPMGMLYAADLIGFSVFQLMQVRLGTTEGAASQLVMVLTAVAYLPGVGIAMAGTTLVGQSIGAGDRDWAYRIGSRIILMAGAYMGGMGLLLALTGPWLLPLFIGHESAGAAEVLALAQQLLWIAAAYQLFDGLSMGSGMCLRGGGDAIIPAALVIVLSWLLFVPLAHVMTFATGQGWISGLPQLGWGARGGWSAVVIYVLLVSLALLWRWHAKAWQRIRI
jgi:MATE family multidrug resistance protein